MKRKSKWPINIKEMLRFHEWWTFIIEMLFMAKLRRHLRECSRHTMDTRPLKRGSWIYTCWHAGISTIVEIHIRSDRFSYSKREGEESNSVCACVMVWVVKKGVGACICVLTWVQRKKQGSTPDCYHLLVTDDDRASDSLMATVEREQKAGDQGSDALTFIHSSCGQSARPQGESCRVQNTTVHRTPAPQGALFSIRF